MLSTNIFPTIFPISMVGPASSLIWPNICVPDFAGESHTFPRVLDDCSSYIFFSP